MSSDGRVLLYTTITTPATGATSGCALAPALRRSRDRFWEASCTRSKRSFRRTTLGCVCLDRGWSQRSLPHRFPVRLGHGCSDAWREHPDLRGRWHRTAMACRRTRVALPHAGRLDDVDRDGCDRRVPAERGEAALRGVERDPGLGNDAGRRTIPIRRARRVRRPHSTLCRTGRQRFRQGDSSPAAHDKQPTSNKSFLNEAIDFVGRKCKFIGLVAHVQHDV